jgi:hypothetical protein
VAITHGVYVGARTSLFKEWRTNRSTEGSAAATSSVRSHSLAGPRRGPTKTDRAEERGGGGGGRGGGGFPGNASRWDLRG